MGTLLKGGSRPNPVLFVVAFLALISLFGTWDLLVRNGYDEKIPGGDAQFDSEDPFRNTGGDRHSNQGDNIYPWEASTQEFPEPLPPPPPADEYTAVLTENDPARVANLAPIVLHFASVLGPKWPITFVTLEEKYKNWTAPPAFRRLVDNKQIRIHYLPPGTEFPSHESVSLFLSGPWLWEQFTQYKRILMFQVDSIVCANSKHSVEDFVEFDLIGAPIKPGIGFGFNGGLSVRNPKMMLAISEDLQRRKETDPNVQSEVDYEDQWFYRKIKERGGKLPEPEIAGRFSVETHYYEKPLGYHQVQKFQQDHQEEIDKYCPEVAMIGKGSHFR
ncbi:uncharacterized protein CTRU02_203342 [Colletotrichum truncatum]|uniref:Uncharacterized protein n=1 Tax=Colletotrichum truncatum TaxID=5467 RepID=A0ACC3Z930_COLTU|nr:uncharacterized protein CTRU02_05729 [Colletotrichum truncatum]KAF6793474.1 hypothetical protein CTRU02_05729 [Colletotrichum truncatum]